MNPVKKFWSVLQKKERGVFLLFASLLVISVVWLLGIAIQKNTTVVPASGGEYREGVVGQPTYVNPILATSYTDKSLVRLLFSSIYDLADKVEMDSTGRSWKVRLKENVFWSDGERITSDDVIFTVQKIQDPESGSPMQSRWQGITAERSSQLELQFTLATPYAFFENNLKELFVLPKHLFAEIPSANWRLSDFNLKPVGSGPYRFVGYEKRTDGFITNYHLEAADHSARAKPFIHDFYFSFFSTIGNAIQAFNSGQIDGVADVTPSDQENILRPHETLSFPLTTYYAAFLNQSTNLALQEQTIRDALSQSVNRTQLINDVFRGAADPTYGPIPQHLLSNIPEPTVTSQSEIIAILEKNGWKLDVDGIRKKKIKNATISFEINITVPRVPFLEKTGEILRNTWTALGAKVVITTIQPGEDLSTIIKNRTYQILLFGNIVSDYGDLFPFWHSSERFSPGLNLSLLSDKNVDRLIESIRQELDQTARTSDLTKLQSGVLASTPAVFLFTPRHLVVTAKNLGGIEVRPLDDIANRFLDVNNWYLHTTRILNTH